jgi:hypothetical protein
VALLIAGFMQIRYALDAWRQDRPIVSWLGIAVGAVLLVGFGEELSWGQHWLGFETPEISREVNVQGEFNLHNIGGYWFNHLVALVFGLYLCVLPVLGRLTPHIWFVLDRIAVPIPPLALFPYGVVAVLMDEHEIMARTWDSPVWRLSEGRELVLACAIVVVVSNMRRYSLESTEERAN